MAGHNFVVHHWFLIQKHQVTSPPSSGQFSKPAGIFRKAGIKGNECPTLEPWWRAIKKSICKGLLTPLTVIPLFRPMHAIGRNQIAPTVGGSLYSQWGKSIQWALVTGTDSWVWQRFHRRIRQNWLWQSKRPLMSNREVSKKDQEIAQLQNQIQQFDTEKNWPKRGGQTAGPTC